MADTLSVEPSEPDLALFEGRMRELHALIPQDERWDDALRELRNAADRLRRAYDDLSQRQLEAVRRRAVVDGERQLMRSAFRDLPLPVLLLDREGRVRRGNHRTSDLLGVGGEFLSGKVFTGFLAVEERAAFRAEFTACIRTGKDTLLGTVLLRQGQPVPVQLSLGSIQPASDPRPLIAVVALPLATASGVGPTGCPPPPRELDGAHPRAQVQREELLSAAAHIILEEAESNQAPLLQRLSRALCSTFADWSVVDLLQEGGLRRAVVGAPPDDASARIGRDLERAPADKAEIAVRVATEATTDLRANVDDADLFGHDERDAPFMTLMRAHTVLSVPITDGSTTLGVITATRSQPRPPFTLNDQASLEEIGDLLGRSLRRRRRSVADPAGLIRAPAPFVPITLPVTSALDVAWTHFDAVDTGATPTPTAPFFDYYDAPGGWGIVLGSAEGDNPDRQAYVAMVRQWARLVGSNGQPCTDVLEQLDAALRRLHGGQPQVSTFVVDMRPNDGDVRMRLCSAGHRTSLLLRADGRVHGVDGGGDPLNDGPGPRLHEDTETLSAGDTMLLYSNEFAEVTNHQGDTFMASGELSAALARGAGRSARTILDGVHAALTSFAAGGRGGDAVVVAVRCTGRPR